MSITNTKSHPLKPCRWIGSSLADMRKFPAQVRSEMGTALMYAQAGERAHNAKMFRNTGPGVVEIVDDFNGDTYRCVYLLRLKGVVYVLHAFQKKSKTGIKTPPKNIALIKSRIKLAEDDYKKRPTP